MKKSLNDKKEYIFDRLKFICHFNLTQLLYTPSTSFALPGVGGGSGGKAGGGWVGRSECCNTHSYTVL
jgi:hypothetical protein